VNRFEGHAKIADNFLRNSFVCGNLSSLTPYFRLLQWRLSTHYRFVPWATAPLVRPYNPALLVGWLVGWLVS